MDIKTFDGHNINDGTNYDAELKGDGYGLPPVGPKLVSREGRWPLIGTVERPGRKLHMDIYIRGASLSTLQEQLYQWFDPEDETAKALVVEDSGGGNDRYINMICESLREVDYSVGRHYVATMQIHGDIRWREDTASTDSWSITASGQTKAITNSGEDDAYPILKIKPTSGKTGGYGLKVWIPVRWRVDAAYSSYPMDICNDSFDTATIVTAGDMQADGDDLRVEVDGVEVDRWLDGIDTATTKVWVNLDFQAKQETTLATAIASSGSVDTIDVDEDISGYPSSGILMIDSEAFTYTGKNNSLKRFTGVTRAAKGTSMAAHTTTDTVWWVQHDIWILYDNSAASAPTVDDDYKPAFELTSTNTSWDYDAFGEDDGLRTGAWSSERYYFPISPTFYGGNQGAAADPWVEIGIKATFIGAFAGGHWKLHNPCGITNANFVNGEKYSTFLSSWAGSGDQATGIYSSEDGSTWTQEDIVGAPTTVDTWEPWGKNEALTSGAQHVAMRCNSGGGSQYLEAADVTLTLDSSYTPVITIGSEQGNYSLAPTITNNTTGDVIELAFTMELDQELEVDTDGKTVIYLADDSSQFQALTLTGGARRDWLPLQPGANELQFDDVGTNGVTVALEWEERMYH